MASKSEQSRSTAGSSEAYTFSQKVGIVAGVVAVFLFVWVAGWVLALLFAGILLGVALRGLGHMVARRSGLSDDVALSLCLTVIVLGLVAAFSLIGREMAGQFERLFQATQMGTEQLRGYLGQYPLGRQVLGWWSELSWQPSAGLLSRVTGVMSISVEVVTNVSIVVGMALFLDYRPNKYLDASIALVPSRHKERARDVLNATSCVLRRWFAGRVIDMAVVGAVTGVALYFMGSPAPLALGLLTGLILFIPFFGPILATIPAALASLPDGPGWALAVVGLFILIQVVEGFVLLPFITEYTVSIPAALMIASQLVMGALLGVVGVLIATPAAAAALVVVQMVYIQDILGEKIEAAGECGPKLMATTEGQKADRRCVD